MSNSTYYNDSAQAAAAIADIVGSSLPMSSLVMEVENYISHHEWNDHVISAKRDIDSRMKEGRGFKIASIYTLDCRIFNVYYNIKFNQVGIFESTVDYDETAKTDVQREIVIASWNLFADSELIWKDKH